MGKKSVQFRLISKSMKIIISIVIKNIKIQNKEVENVDDYEYLGHTLRQKIVSIDGFKIRATFFSIRAARVFNASFDTIFCLISVARHLIGRYSFEVTPSSV